LGYQAHKATANIPQSAFIAACQILAKKLDTPAYAGSGMIEQPENRQSQRAFARPTLAYETHNLTAENIDRGPSQYALPLWVIDGDVD
jgi:hypothetical protein